MQRTVQNTYFNEQFGRNDFEDVIRDPVAYASAVGYILRYIEKTGEKFVYSRGTSMYLVTDINGRDVLAKMGEEEEKLLLADNFGCWENGRYLGKVNDGGEERKNFAEYVANKLALVGTVFLHDLLIAFFPWLVLRKVHFVGYGDGAAFEYVRNELTFIYAVGCAVYKLHDFFYGRDFVGAKLLFVLSRKNGNVFRRCIEIGDGGMIKGQVEFEIIGLHELFSFVRFILFAVDFDDAVL